MSRTVTLEQLRTDILNQADLSGACGTGKRYTNAILNRWINQSIQRFRERLSAEGATHYLMSTSGTFTAGATSPYAFASLDLSSVDPAVVRVYAIDVTVNNEICALQSTDFQARNDYGGPTYTSIPEAFANYQTDKVAILPPPDQAYTYVAWYLPQVDDLAQDSDTFDGRAGWEEFIVWDVVSRMAVRDKYLQVYQAMVGEREARFADIMQHARRVAIQSGQKKGRDTLGTRLYGSSATKRPPPFQA